MAKYRDKLPQLAEKTFLSDGGLETTLIFHEGLELPHFAAFVLLKTSEGRDALERYYTRYLSIARDHHMGFILDTPTWRANADWGALLGYDAEALHRVNLDAVAMMIALRDKHETVDTPCVVSGAIGPRGDGYKAGRMSADEARDYHGAQIKSFAEGDADVVSAYTLSTVEEAIGIAHAARDAMMPCAISFTVETDGRLASGMPMDEAIEMTDAETHRYPSYFLINCAHPTHFSDKLSGDADWLRRIRGVKANASTKSHAELDESETLDEGDPIDLGKRYLTLGQMLPNLKILGGCCGTDHRHVEAMSETVGA